MNKRFIYTAAVVFAVSLLSSCFGFKPTQTNAFNGSSLISPNHSPVSTENSSGAEYSQGNPAVQSSSASTSSEKPKPSVSSSSETRTTEDPENTSSYKPPQYKDPERSERYLELRSELSYDESGNPIGTERENHLAEESLFVGDSICRGLAAFNVIDAGSVYATGSLAARNFFDMDILWYGEKRTLPEALEIKKPKRVFFSMGMNDVNMTSAQEYCTNYKKIIDTALENSDAEIYVCAITPINSNFTGNSRIDGFNSTIKNFIDKNYSERVHFMDFAYVLKNSQNKLGDGLDSGDGIHLMPEPYHVALLEICSRLGID